MGPLRAESVSSGRPRPCWPAAALAGLLVVVLVSNEPLRAQAAFTAEEGATSRSSPESEQVGRELARRLAASSTGLPGEELTAWARKLASSESGESSRAAAVLRGVASEIVAPRRLSADTMGASEAMRLRSFLERVATTLKARLAGDPESASDVWKALEVVTEPLGVGGVVHRTRHAEMLAQTLAPPADWLEERLVAWGLIPRATARLETDVSEVDRIEPNGLSTVQATVISAPTGRVRVDEVVVLLEELAAWDPARRVVVLADGSNYERLTACCSSDVVSVRPSFGRPFSPWPRDAMTFARSGDGSPLLLMRPNTLPGRELDALMGRSILQFADLEQVAGQPVRWLASPVPFHNGQILFTPGVTWVSIHSLERRALEILGLDSVPAASFASQEGLGVYLDAVQRAAGEYEVLFSQPVGLVHPLPTAGPAAEREEQMWRLAGGAGWDLDSLITILPSIGDLPTSLVGSTSLGQALLASTRDEDLRQWLDSLRLSSVSVGAARSALSAPYARRSSLQQFLDVTAEHLERVGHDVVRVPVLVLPQSLAPQLETDVLIGVHNVVLERGRRGPRAEGFRTGLEPLDRRAADVFGQAGYDLRLLQPISDSVLLNAGYRCSTNHLRSGEEIGPGELRHLMSRRSVDRSTFAVVD